MYTTHISFEKQFTPKLNIQSYMQYCNVFGTNALKLFHGLRSYMRRYTPKYRSTDEYQQKSRHDNRFYLIQCSWSSRKGITHKTCFRVNEIMAWCGRWEGRKVDASRVVENKTREWCGCDVAVTGDAGINATNALNSLINQFVKFFLLIIHFAHLGNKTLIFLQYILKYSLTDQFIKILSFNWSTKYLQRIIF